MFYWNFGNKTTNLRPSPQWLSMNCNILTFHLKIVPHSSQGGVQDVTNHTDQTKWIFTKLKTYLETSGNSVREASSLEEENVWKSPPWGLTQSHPSPSALYPARLLAASQPSDWSSSDDNSPAKLSSTILMDLETLLNTSSEWILPLEDMIWKYFWFIVFHKDGFPPVHFYSLIFSVWKVVQKLKFLQHSPGWDLFIIPSGQDHCDQTQGY